MSPEALLGTWRLADFTVARPDGERIHPYGADADGLLIYAPDGWVAATLSRRDRGPFAADALERAGRADDADKVRAFDGYTSYAGRYRIEGDEVVHEIAVSLVPTMAGKELRRRARLEGDVLLLSFDVAGSRGTHRYQLRWRRP